MCNQLKDKYLTLFFPAEPASGSIGIRTTASGVSVEVKLEEPADMSVAKPIWFRRSASFSVKY